MTFEELKEAASKGLIKGKDRVWSNVTPKWVHAKALQGLDVE